LPKKIITMDIEEIALADRPANDRKFLIMKNLDEGGENMTLEEALEKIEAEDVQNLIKSEFENLNDKIEELEKVDDPAEEDDDEEVDLDKADLPEEIRKQVEGMKKELESTRKMAKEEREARLTTELEKEAEDYTDLAKSDDLVTLMRMAKEHDFEEALERVFNSASERIDMSKIENESGDEGESSDAESELEKRAQKLMKEDPDLTQAKAIRKVLEDDPDLYTTE